MTRKTDNDVDMTLDKAMTGDPRLPNVVAIVTDRAGVIYEGARGLRSSASTDPVSPDTELTLFSTTKGVVAVALLQLVEEGRLDLDAPASTYQPAIGNAQVLAGTEEDGTPILRKPKRPITTRMLMLHTAGYGYDNFNETYAQLLAGGHITNPGEGTAAVFDSPLLFEPGEAWEYGISMDWAGRVVEGITGERLSTVLSNRVLGPLGMDSFTFSMAPNLLAKFAPPHARQEDGSLFELDFLLPQNADFDMAGHGLYGNARDFAKFIRMWLNEGKAPNGSILKPETIMMASQAGLGAISLHALPGVNRFMTLDIDMFPQTKKSWALSFMTNEEQAPTGRKAGSLGWVGLANSYYWIDPTSGIGGFWSSQVLPLADPTSIGAYLDFETAVYDSLDHRDHADI